ncbi:MAG TPA: response regulator transcription factor [Rhodocyclaceae bacterium]|nr:response regulator transcription factor [Rhodocyclaceae bacterium]
MTDTRLTILVIDDDPAFSSVLVRSLNRRGWQAYSAETPEKALASAAAHVPEHVVLDLNLGGLSGLTLIPALLAASPGTRIVVLTGYASISTAVDAIKLGAVQYLAKPVEIDAIIAALQESKPEFADHTLPDTPLSVERLEWEHIQRVLKDHEGNISATARALNMHRRTLQRKLSKRPVKQ